MKTTRYNEIDMQRREVTINTNIIVEYDHGNIGRSVYVNDQRAATTFSEAKRLAKTGDNIPVVRFRK